MYLSYRFYTCFIDKGVPVGTTELIPTELILILPIREYRRYHWTYTCFTNTGVPVGTIELLLIRTFRRSYRVSSYTELILITDVSSFGTPVGVKELNQIQEYP